jgi:hypothetical protein
MKRPWRLRRQTAPSPDGQRRWNQVYHLLVEWTTACEPLSVSPTAPASVPAVVYQEADHAHCPVRPRLDPTTSPTADQ